MKLSILLLLLLIISNGTAQAALTDNGNGTVTDSRTGLVWQQGEGGAMIWGSALTYCESLTLAGQSDWKLPDIKELVSLTDDSRSSLIIDTTYFPGANASFYWSSTTMANYPVNAWDVNFSSGSVGQGGSSTKASSYYVRCVRGGQSGAIDSLTILKSGTGTGSVSSSPAGISCGATCSTSFTSSQSVILTATADTGSAFAGWSGCDSTSANQCAVTVSGTINVSATFNHAIAATRIIASPTDNQKVIASFDGAGVYVSGNNGASWTAASTQPANLRIKDLVMNPVNATKLFAASFGGGVFKSTTGGTTWAVCATSGLANLNVQSITMDSSGKIFAGTEGGIFISTDGCATWTASNTGLPN